MSEKISLNIVKISLIAFIILVSNVFFVWLAKNHFLKSRKINPTLENVIARMSMVPHDVAAVGRMTVSYLKKEPSGLLVDRYSGSAANDFNFPCKDDSGYLLLSGLDVDTKQGSVKIIRISDGKIVKRWDPDWGKIYYEATKERYNEFLKYSSNLLPLHPIINWNGDLVFSVRDKVVVHRHTSPESSAIYACPAHHSIELSNDGKSLYMVGYATNSFPFNRFLNEYIKDDSVLEISVGGAILNNQSIYQLLIDAGLESQIFGHSGLGHISNDLLHINQISVAPFDGQCWRKGDLLLSARNNSTIYLYSPSNKKIQWYQRGSWKNQHSAQFVNGSQIALLDNNVYGWNHLAPKTDSFVRSNDVNRVIILDYSESPPKELEPFKALLEERGAQPQTVTEGLIRVLPDGGLFFEETNYGRHFRFTKSKLMWVRNNKYDRGRNGMLSWSRYLTKPEYESIFNKG
jgi:hypothetical protein